MSKTLVIRLSSIGDVAMTIPVVYAAAEANPNDSFTVLTQTFLTPLFMNCPSNIDLLGVNLRTTEKSFFGFLSFAWMLRKYKFDRVLDLHHVIRSWIVDILFYLNGKKVFVVDKRRKERKRLTARQPKVIQPLHPVTARYADVFHRAGFHFEETFVSLFSTKPADTGSLVVLFGEKKGVWIGIAPFAKHQGKIYPLAKMEQVVKALSGQESVTVFLFGSAGEEEETLKQWENKYKNTINVASRKFLFDKTLLLISMLDVHLSMDSANMHLGSLAGTDVISIWGATHPFAGFYGYRQRPDLAIQTALPCRPCSMFGQKPCYRGDWACMNTIEPEQVIHKINAYLKEL